MLKHIFFALTFLGLFSQATAQEAWSLQQCIDYALANNISVQQAALSVDQALVNQNSAKNSFLPTLNASASHGYNWGRSIDPFTNQFAEARVRSNNVGIQAGVVLFNGFRNQNTLAQSNLNLEARKSDVEQMQNDIALNVANTYLNVLFNKEFVGIAKSNFANSTQQTDRVSKLVDAGQSPRGTLLDIQAQLATDEAAVISAENNLMLALLSLRQLLQLPREDAPNFDVQSPNVEALLQGKLSADPQGALLNALNNFPQIRSAETGVLSAEKGIKLANAGYYPSLRASFGFGSGYSGNNQEGVGEQIIVQAPIGVLPSTGETIFSQPRQTFNDFQTKAFNDQLSDNLNRSLFFSLQIPIFNGFAARNSTQLAKINMEQSKFTLENTKNLLTQDVERAYADAKAALQNFQASEKSVAASEEAFRYAEIQYEAGVSTIVDYTQARTRLDNAKAGLIQNRYDYIFKLKVLDFYQGNPISLN